MISGEESAEQELEGNAGKEHQESMSSSLSGPETMLTASALSLNQDFEVPPAVPVRASEKTRTIDCDSAMERFGVRQAFDDLFRH